uniref:Uncharacterized protein n=1 Tax=Acrobeloides nanus TaxID=290746 RepID=A0A914CD31_9BILA
MPCWSTESVALEKLDSDSQRRRKGIRSAFFNYSPFLLSASSETKSTKRMSICSSCGQQITDRFILRVHPNLEFHAGCLKCTDCNRFLDETCTAFVRNGKTFCKEDYLKLFGRKCRRCDQQFQRNDLVMRARNLVYHYDCFSCHSCNKQLASGEHFVVHDDDELYCPKDCLLRPSSVKTVKDDEEWDSIVGCSEKDVCCPLSPAASPALSNKSPSTTSDEQSMSSLQQPTMPQTPSTSVPPNLGNNGLMHFGQRHSGSTSSSSNGSTIGSGGIKKKKDKPSTRVRTVLSETQLRILKQMYGNNTRPDAMTKEQLSEMTGLSARVIRVWFQNKRCKDKKRQNAMREQQKVLEKEQALHGVRINGIGPLIAASPTSLQDPNLNMGAIDIHQFPQNPVLWATNCMDTSGGHLQRGPSMDGIQPPPPYQPPNLMMQGPHPGAGGFTDLGGPMDIPGAYAMLGHQANFGLPHGIQLDPSDFSPQLGASSLSSPSCSD